MRCMVYPLFKSKRMFGGIVASLAALFLPKISAAEDVFLSVPLAELTFTSQRPNLAAVSLTGRWNGKNTKLEPALTPYVVLDGKGEGYIGCNDTSNRPDSFSQNCASSTLVVKYDTATPVSGLLVLPDFDKGALQKVAFSIPDKRTVTPSMKDDFLRVKRAYYSHLMNRGVPGGSWFRFQMEQLGDSTNTQAAANFRAMRARPDSLEDTLTFLSGGKAISENLQLDRNLLLTKFEKEGVSVETLGGITVAEIDWAPRIKDKNPVSDPLATLIPADQYAVFIPSLPILNTLIQQMKTKSSTLLPLFEQRSEDSLVFERYQRQLCLPLNDFLASVARNLVKSVAVTSSDPYLRTGTDLAVVLESGSSQALAKIFEGIQATSSAGDNSVKIETGVIEDVSYKSARSSDRKLSSYVADIGGAVIVTNSKVQLAKIVRTYRNKTAALASLGEYVYFRDRYKLQSAETDAFLIVPDQAIRKWAGPTWRIAASRRVRANAVLMDLQIKHSAELVSGVDNSKVIAEPDLAPLGTVSINQTGISSTNYGSVEFMTPISELDLTKASSEEAEAYRRFRDTYSTYWRTFFDPIGAKIRADARGYSADLTVLPVIAGSEYNSLKHLSNGVGLTSVSGDPHSDALINVTVALDSSGQTMNMANGWGAMFMPSVTNPLGWVGNAASIYLDDAPIWQEIAQATDKEKLMSDKYRDIPVGIYVEVKDSLKLTIFMSALRGVIEQSSPGMTTWKTQVSKSGVSYVQVQEAVSSPLAASPVTTTPWSIYYAVTPKALIVSLREDVLLRALDRHSAAKDASANAEREFIAGSAIAIETNEKLVPIFEAIYGSEFLDEAKLQCWSNVPILNELRRSFPEKDPLSVYRTLWRTDIFCPSGGEYRWNDDWKTMESTRFGHAGSSVVDGKPNSFLDGLLGIKFALGFEDDGIRAKVIAATK